MDGSKSISEKEFITKFIEYLDNEKWRGIIPNYDAIDEWLDEWLKEFHKKYCEVEFIEKKVKPLDIVDDREIIRMDDGDYSGDKYTEYTSYDGVTIQYTKCFEDNEGFERHKVNCNGTKDCDIVYERKTK